MGLKNTMKNKIGSFSQDFHWIFWLSGPQCKFIYDPGCVTVFNSYLSLIVFAKFLNTENKKLNGIKLFRAEKK